MARVDGVAGCGAVSSYVTVLTGVPPLFDASHVRVAHPGTAQRLKFQGESARASCAHGLLLFPMDMNRRAAEICLQWATGRSPDALRGSVIVDMSRSRLDRMAGDRVPLAVS